MISCVVTQAPAITVSERLRNSAHTVEGGGSRYSLIPVRKTALSQNANSSANTISGAARFLSHVPRLERRAGADVSMRGTPVRLAARLGAGWARGEIVVNPGGLSRQPAGDNFREHGRGWQRARPAPKLPVMAPTRT